MPGGGSSGARPSEASVAMFAASSFWICVRRIPATRERWSTRSQCALQSGKKSQRAVTTGITSGGFTQITDGLSRGDLVVVTIPTQVAGTSNSSTRNSGTRTGGGGGGFVRPGD